MKSKNSLKIIFLITLFFSSILLYAEKKENSPKRKFVNIEIFILDTILRNASIQFKMCKDDLNSDYSKNQEIYDQKITNESNSFKIPLSSEINYGRITFKTPMIANGYDDILNTNNNLFIFANGDSIKIYIQKNNLVFTGRGSEKFNCLYEISKNKYDIFKKAEVCPGQSEWDAQLSTARENRNIAYHNKLNTLKNFKTKLSPYLYTLIEADCWGEYNEKLVGNFINLSSMSKENQIKKDRSIFYAYSDFTKKFEKDKFKEDVLAKSYRYCDFLLKKERFKMKYLTSVRAEKYTFQELYNSINNNYTGLIRDKVTLLAFFHESLTRSDTHLLFPEVTKQIGNNNFKLYLSKYIANISGNAFPFEMPDKNGKIYKLQDFKGKVLIMDFWFTGCLNCAILAKQMKPIISSYKSNPNVVFITVSVDGDDFKNMWLNSLQKETYSSKDEINLLARKGMNSEIIKYYNITGYPALIIISKEGKIISTSPPRPNVNNLESSELFKNFIDKYL